MVSTLPPQQPQQTIVDVPPPAPSSSYMKFKLAPPTTKTKMLELLVRYFLLYFCLVFYL